MPRRSSVGNSGVSLGHWLPCGRMMMQLAYRVIALCCPYPYISHTKVAQKLSWGIFSSSCSNAGSDTYSVPTVYQGLLT